MRKFHVFAVSLVVVSTAATASMSWADSATTIAQAKQMYQEGRFAEVIELLTSTHDESTLAPGEAKEKYLLLAKASAGKDFKEQAIVYLRKVLELDPSFRLQTKIEPPQVQRVWFAVDSMRTEGEEASKTQTVAILYFENNSIADRQELDGLSKGLSAMLITDLTGQTGLRILERERIQYILDELRMQRSEYFDPRASVAVGKQLGAHYVLMGSFSKLDKNNLRIDARLVKTETGEVIKSDKVEGKPSQLAKLQNNLTAKVADLLGVKLAQAPKDGGQPIEAVLAYTRGLNFEDEMQLTEAYAAYKEALAAYPKMDAARDRIVALEPYITVSGG